MARTRDHFVMSTTAFTPEGGIDEPAFRSWLRRFADLGLGVYVASGGNGEGHALTKDELREVYRISVSELKGKVPVHANLPEEHTARQTIVQAQLAAEAGVDAVHLYVLESRHGMKPTDRELRTYFEDVLSAVDHPVCIAINPTVGPVPSAAFVADLVKRYPQIVSIRMSHQLDIYMIELKRRIEREVEYYSLFESGGIFAALAMGATAFSGAANLMPKTFRRFVDLCDAGRFDEVVGPLTDLRRFNDYGSKFGSNARWLKMAMKGFKLAGGEGGLRRPYLMPRQDELDAFMKGLVALNIAEIDELAVGAGLKAS